jgi:ATP-dependent RNA helicase RhlE
MHGNKSQGQRERALSSFERGHVDTLVATDVAARGLDVDDITHVINFDPPEEPDVYTHRVGRTGRAGRGGIGITLVLPEQQADVSHVARKLGHAHQFESEGMRLAPARRVYTSRRGRRSRW